MTAAHGYNTLCGFDAIYMQVCSWVIRPQSWLAVEARGIEDVWSGGWHMVVKALHGRIGGDIKIWKYKLIDTSLA